MVVFTSAGLRGAEQFNFTTLAGPAGGNGYSDGTGSVARFNNPIGVAVDSAGNLYVADTINHTIRKVTPAGEVSTLAGLAGSNLSADGNGGAARFYFPTGVATDSTGNVYVADSGNSTIRKVTPTGTVSTVAGLAGSGGSDDGMGSVARFNHPQGVAVDSAANVYVVDGEDHTIGKITPSGVGGTFAGLILPLAWRWTMPPTFTWLIMATPRFGRSRRTER
ncbi:MAG: hypothetical protein DME26_13985 [Verrucomicrobia bacterium]|nr:MAG: hypothetical protein DME26_13985 [Verrucomicrobiota bacterium]